MSDKPKLLIDVGNTHLKYTWFTNDILENLPSHSLSFKALPSLLVHKPEVLICSVKSTAANDELIKQLNFANVTYCLALTKSKEFGITNSYKNVSNMGTDRWMAILGADALVSEDFIAVDAGTAITCDFVANKQHLGGWIAPGLSMLRSTVVSNTQRVFDFSDVEAQLSLGTDTANCVANGALAQILGMIQQAHSLMQLHSQQFTLVITGGDRHSIAQHLRLKGLNLVLHNNLVLAGLARLSEKETTFN